MSFLWFMKLSIEWSKYINPSILRFEFDRDQSDRIDNILEEFREHKSVYWHEEDGPIEVCAYVPLEFYEKKEPVVVQVYEWTTGTDKEGYKCPIPLKYDFFLGLVSCSEHVGGATGEKVLNLINKENRLKVKRRLRKLGWKESLEETLKKALDNLKQKAE